MSANPQAPAAYSPVPPFTVVSSNVFVQDITPTTQIMVDTSQGGSSIGPFTNPVKKLGESVVLQLVSDTNAPTLVHVRRDASSHSGWSLNALTTSSQPQEVCAGTNGTEAGTPVYAFYHDGTNLFCQQLQDDGVTWAGEVAVANSLFPRNLRVAYSSANRMIVYGNDTNGDLFIASMTATSFSAVSVPIGTSLLSGSYCLAVSDVGSDPMWYLAIDNGGQPAFYTGTIGSTTAQALQSTAFPQSITQIVLGTWNGALNSEVFVVLGSDDNLYMITTSGEQVPNFNPVSPISGNQFFSATGYVNDADSTLHIYTIDTGGNVVVLHQVLSGRTGAPAWATPIPIRQGLSHLTSDAYPFPNGTPALFSLDGNNALLLHEVDSQSSLWKGGYLQTPAMQMIPTRRFRSEINLLDSNKVPVPSTAVSVSVDPKSNMVDVVVNGQSYTIDQNGTSLQTDAAGKLTLNMMAMTGIGSPKFTVTVGDSTLTWSPSDPVLNYLAGKAPLNPSCSSQTGSGPLSASGVSSATASDGSSLFPAASNNSSIASSAFNALQASASYGLGTYEQAGFHYDAPAATFLEFATQEELDAHLATFSADESGVFAFFGDIWEGICQGVIAIEKFTVTVANKLANLTVGLVNGLQAGISAAIDAVEKVASVIVGVFKAIEADVEKAIEWLEALFDFEAIWHTKMAFEKQFTQVPTYVVNMIALVKQSTDGWFSQQESAVNTCFQTLIQSLDPTTTFSGYAPAWQDPSQGTNGSSPIGSTGLTGSDFGNNVHHNWLMDQLSSFLSSLELFDSNDDVTTALNDVESTLNDAGTTFQDAVTVVWTALQDVFTNLGNQSVSGFVTLLQQTNNLIISALKLLDQVCDDFFDLATAVMNAIGDQLTKQRDFGEVLNALWSYLASEGGQPDDTPSIVGLISLMAAFPCTIIYKIVEGVDSEPFPQGQPFAMDADSAPGQHQEVAAIMQILYCVAAVIGTVAELGGLYGALTFGLSILIWVFWNGLPDLSAQVWEAIGGTILASLFWVVPAAAFIIQSAAAMTTLGALATIGTSLHGLFSLIVAIISVAQGQITSKDLEAAAILIPIPNMFSFLSLVGGTAATAAIVVFDVAGYVGGGACELAYSAGSD